MKFKNRLLRLLIPYIIWPLIFFIIDNNLYFNKKISLHDLKLQLIIGRQFSIPLWFLFSMIFLTILFIITIIIFKHYFLFVLQILCIISYIMQYSHYFYFFEEYKDNVKFPIIQTINILPLSFLGLIFSSFKIVDSFKSYRKNTLFLSYLFIYILFIYEVFVNLSEYGGIIYIFSSISFFMGFYLLPLENLRSFTQKLIKQITSYTNGIYCLHTRINRFFRIKFGFNGTLKNNFIIYLISYYFSFIGIKLFGKTRLKYLFS